MLTKEIGSIIIQNKEREKKKERMKRHRVRTIPYHCREYGIYYYNAKSKLFCVNFSIFGKKISTLINKNQKSLRTLGGNMLDQNIKTCRQVAIMNQLFAVISI